MLTFYYHIHILIILIVTVIFKFIGNVLDLIRLEGRIQECKARWLRIIGGISRFNVRIADGCSLNIGKYAVIFITSRSVSFNAISFVSLLLVSTMFHSIFTLMPLYLLHIQYLYSRVYFLLDHIKLRFSGF